MKLIDFQPEHETEFYKMCLEFFSSPAVCHEIKPESMKTTYQNALSGSPFMRGLMFVEEAKAIGYLLLSFTYSNEVGGMVVWIEEIFLKEEYRNKGYAKFAFDWIFREYGEKAKRFRLEVTEENKAAKRLYRSLGFTELPYEQMVIDKE